MDKFITSSLWPSWLFNNALLMHHLALPWDLWSSRPEIILSVDLALFTVGTSTVLITATLTSLVCVNYISSWSLVGNNLCAHILYYLVWHILDELSPWLWQKEKAKESMSYEKKTNSFICSVMQTLFRNSGQCPTFSLLVTITFSYPCESGAMGLLVFWMFAWELSM